ncbi:MAG: sulfatase [Gemmatimonadales bacterium]
MLHASDTPVADLPGVPLLVLWTAMVSGLLEAGFRAVQHFGLGRVVLIPPDVAWMAPLADLVWIGVPAGMLLVARRIIPGIITRQLLWSVTLGIGFLPLILLATGMHKLVALVLAFGLGLQAARFLQRHADRSGAVIRRSTPWLLALVLLSGIILQAGPGILERRALAATPAAAEDRPSVLLIIWDTVREQSLSTYGYELETSPTLSRLAQTGVRFDLAFSTAPWTLPSHGSMFTGYRPRAFMRGRMRPISDTLPTLAEVLTTQGYATAGFVANILYAGSEHGLSRGFLRYEDYPLSASTVVLASRLGRVISDQDWVRHLVGYYNLLGRKDAGTITADFLDWQAGLNGRPYFAFLNYFDAHRPYMPPREYRERFVTLDGDGLFPRWEHADLDRMQAGEVAWTNQLYDAGIAYLDTDLGRLLDSLADRGVLDNTIVIVTSDHGEHFGDHDRVEHMNSLYRQLLHVPLVIRYPPRVPAGTVVADAVSLVDLPATILRLAGAEEGGRLGGASLSRYWTGGPAGERPIFAEFAQVEGIGPYSIVVPPYHYINWGDRKRPVEVYDLNQDPLEAHNLADDPGLVEVVAGFERLGSRLVGPREQW